MDGMLTNEEYLDTLIRIGVALRKNMESIAIYLIGGRARGDRRRDSDYDVVVVVPDHLGPGYDFGKADRGVIDGIARLVEAEACVRKVDLITYTESTFNELQNLHRGGGDGGVFAPQCHQIGVPL